MKLVKFENEAGNKVMINPKMVESLFQYREDLVHMYTVNQENPYVIKGDIEEVNKKLTEDSKIDSIAGLMVIVFIGIYILSTLANLLS
ncbi:hypothetical protein B124-14_052 [Bacteroides phage B124-14]|jgi:hypothetical protein|uniref:hypothetical protein n=1 Tax=Bacteroides phage B124-14 TaxID=1105171 RepID=UPI0002459C82|nr:hypothetical protein B124-14_052 [Bacteroides phage B124-14]CCE45981.1 hypothetical protein B124-14_052 [Bacteroides phage B124-14]DAT39950.1 MAG TPA: hypothetical protein [Bacteriophage sp.]